MTTTTQRRIENIVEQKLLEFLGDPDTGLTLKKSFVSELRRRLKNPQKYIPHAEVMRRYGLN